VRCEFTVFTSLVLASQCSRGGMQVCTLFHNLSEDEKGLYEEVVVDIRVSVACCSFIGSLLVIAMIWLFKKYKFHTQVCAVNFKPFP